MGYIEKIVEYKKKEIEKRKKKKLKKRKFPILNFRKAIDKKGRISLIAEIKKKSPSAGVICNSFDPVKIACIYEESGADAISVLTDKRFFGGSTKYISKIKEKVDLPVLAKDFFLNEYQIYEAFSAGADAFLIIVSVLDDNTISRFLKLAKKLKISAVVEVHTTEELIRALKLGADIIGINNRSLRTFRTDITTTAGLVRYIPDDRIVISESGIRNSAQVRYLLDNEVDSILVGTELMKCKNTQEKISELLYV